MKSSLFSIRDQKVGVFNNPFIAPNVNAIIRQFGDAVANKDGDLGKYPQDFDLYEVGSFNPETGVIDAYGQPKHVFSCVALVNSLGENKSV